MCIYAYLIIYVSINNVQKSWVKNIFNYEYTFTCNVRVNQAISLFFLFNFKEKCSSNNSL